MLRTTHLPTSQFLGNTHTPAAFVLPLRKEFCLKRHPKLCKQQETFHICLHFMMRLFVSIVPSDGVYLLRKPSTDWSALYGTWKQFCCTLEGNLENWMSCPYTTMNCPSAHLITRSFHNRDQWSSLKGRNRIFELIQDTEEKKLLFLSLICETVPKKCVSVCVCACVCCDVEDINSVGEQIIISLLDLFI